MWLGVRSDVPLLLPGRGWAYRYRLALMTELVSTRRNLLVPGNNSQTFTIPSGAQEIISVEFPVPLVVRFRINQETKSVPRLSLGWSGS